MEAKKKNGNFGKRIALTAFSIVLSLSFISLAVYAALSQTVGISNSITIATDGQAQTEVKVFETKAVKAAGASAFDTKTLTSALNFPELPVITKTQTENDKTGTVEAILFSETAGINYYAYKITFANSTNSAVNYLVSLFNKGTTDIYVPNNQVVMSSSKGTAGLAAYAPLTGKLEKSATETLYIVFSTNVSLADLVSSPESNFDLKINLTVAP